MFVFKRKKREMLGLRCVSSIAKEFGPFVFTAPQKRKERKNTEMRDMRYLTGRSVLVILIMLT